MSYRTLDPVLIIGTAERLEERIADRFPNSGLRKVAAGLVHLSRDLAKAAKELERPIWWVRILIGLAIAIGASVFLFVGTFLSFDRISTGAFDFVQGIEASLNTLLLAGLGGPRSASSASGCFANCTGCVRSSTLSICTS
jgi:hypothetical protein